MQKQLTSFPSQGLYFENRQRECQVAFIEDEYISMEHNSVLQTLKYHFLIQSLMTNKD